MDKNRSRRDTILGSPMRLLGRVSLGSNRVSAATMLVGALVLMMDRRDPDEVLETTSCQSKHHGMAFSQYLSVARDVVMNTRALDIE